MKRFFGSIAVALAAATVASASLATEADATRRDAATTSTVLPYAVASRAFDRVKPAIVRVETRADISFKITLPVMNGDAIRAWRESEGRRLAPQIADGSLTLSSFINKVDRDFTNEMNAHAEEFFSPGTDTRRDSPSIYEVGSGAVVSSDGVVITASSDAPSDAETTVRLRDLANVDLTRGLQDETDGAASDIADNLSSGLPPDVALDRSVVGNLANSIVNSYIAVALKSLTNTSAVSITRSVTLGPISDQSTNDTLAATVVGSTGTAVVEGLTVLRLKTAVTASATNMPTAAIGAAPLASDQPVAVVGYDAAPLPSSDWLRQPTHLEATVEPPTASDAHSRVSVGFDHGKVGGPLLDVNGAIVGIAVGQRDVVGADDIRAALATASVATTPNPVAAIYGAATDDIGRQYFRRAEKELRNVLKLAPAYPYAATLLKRSIAAVTAHQDRTPAAMPVFVVLFAALLSAASCCGLGVVVVRKRRLV